MAVLAFLVEIFGAGMLLLVAVRLVRSGIDRVYGPRIRKGLASSLGLGRAALIGTGLAIVLQGATAVVLIVTGFVASGALALPVALAMALGADLGSALVIVVLSRDIAWVVPLLLAVGGWLYLNAARTLARNIGRVMVGIALVFLSLDLMRAAVVPLQSAAILPAIFGYFETDPVLAFLVGAALAFLMHSSVAAILICVALLQAGLLTGGGALIFVLGANLGSTLVPLWLTRSEEPRARVLPRLLLLLRGGLAMTVALALILLGHPALDLAPEILVLGAHIAFNLLLTAAVPVSRHLAGALGGSLGARADAPETQSQVARLLAHGADAVSGAEVTAALRQDVLRLHDRLCTLIHDLEGGHEALTDALEASLIAQDAAIHRMLNRIRRDYAALPTEALHKPERRALAVLLEYGIKLAAASDLLASRVLPVMRERKLTGIRFSTDGRAEIDGMHAALRANTLLAFEVLSGGGLDTARELVRRKEAFSKLEQDSRARHLKRLSRGNAASLDSSELHLDLINALKEANTLLAFVAYPLLRRAGQLSGSRLQGPDPVTPEETGS